MEGCCDHGNEHSGSVTMRGISGLAEELSASEALCSMQLQDQVSRVNTVAGKVTVGRQCLLTPESHSQCLVVTVHSASLSSGEHVLSQGIYVVGIGWYRSSIVVH